MSHIHTNGFEGVFPVCNKCKNHIDGLKCKAFDVIPDAIIFGDNDHSKPLPGQGNNIIFESVNKTSNT
ncbi:hypothetical protein UFOVP1596_47 [uncultured Caudovirales phage]|uniref:Uncharacterized protein n=1 Tax=uncultured Caudovirales phage TaxID=2100421 RepID=A0A6J5SU70_9CAUD|nr:hypothetical protein UFOVP1596_47 [uncultured Caudovirales phage]